MAAITYASITLTTKYSVCTHRLVSIWLRRERWRSQNASPTVSSPSRRNGTANTSPTSASARKVLAEYHHRYQTPPEMTSPATP
jgi:hypothetical protein